MLTFPPLASNKIRWCIHGLLNPVHLFFPLSSVCQVTLIPGDGVGAEITDSVKEIFEAVNAPIDWDQYNVSGMSSTGESLFREAMDSLKRNKVGLKGMAWHFRIMHST